jgi:hypothetical protein
MTTQATVPVADSWEGVDDHLTRPGGKQTSKETVGVSDHGKRINHRRIADPKGWLGMSCPGTELRTEHSNWKQP